MSDEVVVDPFENISRQWAWYTGQTIDFMKMTRESLRELVTVLGAKDLIGAITKTATREQRVRWDQTATDAMNEISRDFALLHSIILMGTWGTFEAFVNDVCGIASQLTYDGLPEGPKPTKKNTEPSVYYGVGKSEADLWDVGLSDFSDISPELQRSILLTKQVRNGWAHSRGRPNNQVLEECGANFTEEELTLSTDMIHQHLAAIVTYSVVIMNRVRTRRGLPKQNWPFTEGNTRFADPYMTEWGVDTAGWSTTLPIFFSPIDLSE